MTERQHIALAAAALDQPRWLCLECGQRLRKGSVRGEPRDYQTCKACGEPELCAPPSDYSRMKEQT
ncbi:MAG: hypothetical protein Q4F71_04710 [Paracoccus sp. (in: a-proteobacteria)]|nr:hypothetical protein [Paracoccus sp. (in: a-proteobacteria)]